MAINGEVPAKQLLAAENKSLGAAHLPSLTYLPTYLPTFRLSVYAHWSLTSPTYPLTTQLPTYSPIHLFTYPPTHLPTYLLMYLGTKSSPR
jgi:hypothetical protein